MKIGKIAVLVLLICVCGILGFMNFGKTERKPPVEELKVPAQTPVPDEAKEDDEDLFSSLRLQRRSNREEELSMLREILENDRETQEGASIVSRRIVELTEYYEQERQIEQQLILRGYEEAFSFVQENLVTVAVRGEISQQESTFIKKLVLQITGQKESALHILPIV